MRYAFSLAWSMYADPAGLTSLLVNGNRARHVGCISHKCTKWDYGGLFLCPYYSQKSYNRPPSRKTTPARTLERDDYTDVMSNLSTPTTHVERRGRAARRHCPLRRVCEERGSDKTRRPIRADAMLPERVQHCSAIRRRLSCTGRCRLRFRQRRAPGVSTYIL